MGKTSHMDPETVVIEMKDIVKKFGDFTANDHISLTVHRGEVHAILGENGAGKSTMMNVLCGLYKPTSGEILINGKEVRFASPKDAIDMGIGMVHQHFMLIQPFTVADNIILGVEPVKGLVIDHKTAREKVVELSERYGMKVDPDAKVEDISVGMQQRVEILKVLYRGADTLILDEPTASLTPQEIEGLMEIIENLTADGKSVILITHKLKEITACADSCTIIRQGKYIRTVKVDEVNENDLAAMMVGRDVNFKVEKKEMTPGEVVLEVRDIHARDYRDVEILRGLNLSVRRGEIVGLAGVDGNGQTELVEVLTGFKFIGQQILKNEHTGHGTYLFGLEESYGCLIGTYARDKDAISATVALCEAAAYYRTKNMTLWDAMLAMYEKYGYYKDAVKSIELKGIEGLAKIQEILETLRNNTPETIGSYKVVSARDYKLDTIKDMATGEVKPTGLPASNVLYYDLNDGAWLCVRPSGTEPKVKFYYGIKGTSLDDADAKSAALGQKVLDMINEML